MYQKQTYRNHMKALCTDIKNPYNDAHIEQVGGQMLTHFAVPKRTDGSRTLLMVQIAQREAAYWSSPCAKSLTHTRSMPTHLVVQEFGAITGTHVFAAAFVFIPNKTLLFLRRIDLHVSVIHVLLVAPALHTRKYYHNYSNVNKCLGRHTMGVVVA